MGQGSWVCVPAHSSDSAHSSLRGVALGGLCLKGFVRDAWEVGEEAASFQIRLQQSFLLLPLCLETNYDRREKGHDS